MAFAFPSRAKIIGSYPWIRPIAIRRPVRRTWGNLSSAVMVPTQ